MKKPLQIYLKNLLCAMLYLSGFVRLYCLFVKLRKPSCRILCYHSINTPPTQFFTLANRLQIIPEQFTKQLKYLRQRFQLLSEEQFIQHLYSSNGFSKESALITFDDGYYDNFENAFSLPEN